MSEKIKERINELEERLGKTKVNKATQKSVNFIKAQLAKLRDDLITITTSKKGGGGGFGIKKSGMPKWRSSVFPPWVSLPC